MSRAAIAAALLLLNATCSYGLAAEQGRKQATSHKTSAKPAPALPIAHLQLGPAPLVLEGADATQTLLTTGQLADGRRIDLSQQATYTVGNPRIARVSADGILTPLADGQTKVTATCRGQRAVSSLLVKGAHRLPPVSFTNQLLPVLTKAGCNNGGCHGKATGQNGFKLSLLGYDPRFDYEAIVKEGRGRRVALDSPDRSLFLTKPTGVVPHGGGVRFKVGSPEYTLIRRWLAEGRTFGDPEKEPHITGITVAPSESILHRKGDRQRLVVTALYSDQSRRDVTREAQYVSNDGQVAGVATNGLVTTNENTGDAAIMVRYMGQVGVSRITVPMEERIARFPNFPRQNFVDDLVYAKLKKLNVTPSDLCSDREFIRRASLDTIGTLPTPEEVRAFVTDTDRDKRAKLVDKLLDRPEYADFWAQRWAEILRNKTRFSEAKVGSWQFHYWIRDAFANNMPYDAFARAILTAQGDGASNPPVNWYREVNGTTNMVNDSAQLFLGMRMQCANCHHHPYEKWGQDDYYSYAAFFARVARKDLGSGAQAIYIRANGEVRHPVTGKRMQPKAPDGPLCETGEFDDPRQKLADWMTAPDNAFFARAMVNRLWKHYLGRGLVEPVDDLRLTNPPSNPELMDALARDFVQSKYDIKHLAKVILTSRTYQLSATPRGNNLKDTQNFSRAYAKRLPAEVLLDAVNQVCGTQDKFNGLPAGTRAIALPDETIPSGFLDVFGRPQRESACECERSVEGNLAQTLLIMNSPELNAKVRNDKGRVATLIEAKKTDPEAVEELFLWALSRPPLPGERKTSMDYLAASKDRKAALEDLLWAQLNTNEFMFNH